MSDGPNWDDLQKIVNDPNVSYGQKHQLVLAAASTATETGSSAGSYKPDDLDRLQKQFHITSDDINKYYTGAPGSFSDQYNAIKKESSQNAKQNSDVNQGKSQLKDSKASAASGGYGGAGSKSSDRLLEAGAPGLKAFRDFLPLYKEVGGQFKGGSDARGVGDFSEVQKRYNEQRGIPFDKFADESKKISDAAHDSISSNGDMGHNLDALFQHWHGTASAHAQEFYQRQTDVVRNHVAKSLDDTAHAISVANKTVASLVRAKADWVLENIRDDNETLGGKTVDQWRDTIAVANGTADDDARRRACSAWGVDISNATCGNDVNDATKEKIRRKAEQVVVDPFVKQVSLAWKNFIAMCDDTKKNVDRAWKKITDVSGKVEANPFTAPQSGGGQSPGAHASGGSHGGGTTSGGGQRSIPAPHGVPGSGGGVSGGGTTSGQSVSIPPSTASGSGASAPAGFAGGNGGAPGGGGGIPTVGSEPGAGTIAAGMPGAGGIPAAAGQRGTGATGPHGAPGLRSSGSAGTRQGRRPGAHGRPETVSLRTADGRTMNVTSPDGQGQVRITVDDGSGHPKAYDIDFSQGAGLAKGGATAQGGGFAGGDMGQPGAHGSLDTSGLGQQSAMPGDAGSVDPTRVGMAGAGQGGSGLPGQDAPAGPPDTGPGSDPGAAGQGLNAAGGTAHAIHPDASGTAVIHDGDTTITVTHPDGGSGELKISVDDGSGPPSSYTIEHSTSGADTAAAGQPADPSSPGQPSGSGTGVPAHLGSASVGATGAAYQASLAPDTGGAANQLGFASPASAGGGAPIQHDLASPAAAGSGAPAGGPPAGAGGMHDAAIGGSTPLQAGTGGLSSTTGAAAVAGGAPGPWAGAAGGGVPSHDPQASGLTQGDPSAPAHSGATPGVASLVPSGDPGAGGPGLAQAPGGDPAIGGDQGGHQAGGMPMMGGMGGGQGAQGGDSERGASPWRTSGQLFDDDAEVATIDRISRILGEE